METRCHNLLNDPRNTRPGGCIVYAHHMVYGNRCADRTPTASGRLLCEELGHLGVIVLTLHAAISQDGAAPLTAPDDPRLGDLSAACERLAAAKTRVCGESEGRQHR
jgi:hypothetical protein